MYTANDYSYYVVMVDNEFVGKCDSFPSCSWISYSPHTALRGIKQLVSKILADMLINGEVIPLPKGE